MAGSVALMVVIEYDDDADDHIDFSIDQGFEDFYNVPGITEVRFEKIK